MEVLQVQYDELEKFVLSGELIKKIVESAIITLFLALLAPLLQFLRAQERKRELAHDIMLFLEFEKIAAEGNDLGRAAAHYVRKNTHLDDIVGELAAMRADMANAAPRTTEQAAVEIEAAFDRLHAPAPYNQWDLIGSLSIPTLVWALIAFVLIVEPPPPPAIAFIGLLIGFALSFWLSYLAGKKIARSFSSEWLQRFFQILLSLFVTTFASGLGLGLAIWLESL